MTESRIEELRRRVRRDPGSRLFAQLAEEERRAGRLEEAIRVAREGLAVHPGDPAGLLTLGWALTESGDFGAATGVLQEALERAPGSVVASRLLAVARQSQCDPEGASVHYQGALRMAPGDEQAAKPRMAVEARIADEPRGRAEEPAEDGREEADRRGQRSALSGSPSPGAPPFSSATLAELYLRQGFLESAFEVYRQVVAARPGDAKARARLAEIAARIGEEGASGAGDAQQRRRRAVERTIAMLEVWLGVARRR